MLFCKKTKPCAWGKVTLSAKDGRLIQTEFVSNVYLVGRKKVIQCNIRDISERQQTEGMRAQLAAIVDSSEDAIIGKTLEGLITSWNSGAERLYGYSAAEAIGRPVSFLIPPDHPDELPKILARLKRGENIRHFETARIRKDGRHLVVSLTISPIKDNSGRLIGASAIARDITGHKQAEERIRRQLEFLTALSAIDRIIAANFDLNSALQKFYSI